MENVVENISRKLVSRGHQVDVYTANISSVSDELRNGIRVRRFPVLFDLGTFAKIWPGFLRVLSRESYDVIHTHVYRHPHSTAVGLYSKATRKNAIISTHGPFHPPSVWGKLAPFVRAHDVFLGRTLGLFKKVLVLGKLERELLKRMHIPEDKIEIFTNGVEPEHFERHNPDSFLSKYRIKEQYLCYVGRIHPTKGLEFLLRSFAKINDSSELVIAGSGEPTYTDSLKSLARQLRLHDRVTFTGYISDNEKLQMLEGCAGLVLPSKYEPFGISLIEAMAHSKPVIGTYPGGTDFVDHNENGFLLRYGDEKGLQDSMSSILNDLEARNSMGRKGYELARNSTWDLLVDRLERIYEDVIN